MHRTPIKTVEDEGIVAELRRRFNDFKPRQLTPGYRADLRHGWLLPTLLHRDDGLWGRWNYWASLYQAGALPRQPIPRLDLLTAPHPATRRMLEASLDGIPSHGAWRTWGSWSYFDYLLSWLLFGLGYKGQKELPPEPAGCAGASDRLHQLFCLDALLLWPHDYWGDLLCESSYGKSQGFYPTPHTVCEFMARMLCDEQRDEKHDEKHDRKRDKKCDEKRDVRIETVLDPCVGTGRMLLHASNHSLRLYGMDIDPTLCKATLVNGYLYAPWLVRPIPWLDGELAAMEKMPGDGRSPSAPVAAELSDFMAAAAPPHAQAYLRDSEHDPDVQPAVAPLLKRRKKRGADPTQGTLF
jgi:hypothetical protein